MDKYLKNIAQKFSDPQTSEMGYRTDFENLLESIFTKEQKYRIHHDAKAVGGNKPDFIILKNAIPVLYIEVKDIGVDLNKIEKSDQADRYFGYDNLIISDYVNFRFFRNGQKYNEEISLGDIDKNQRYIKIKEENSKHLTKTILDFVSSHKEAIKSGIQLARIMGGKAKRIRENVCDMLENKNDKYSDLFKMLDVVKQNLISNLDDKTFADMYAQTLVYGLFVARYNDKTPENFSRFEARELVPKTNPFLRSFFDHITGNTFPDRLKYIVDELCEVFQHANVEKLLTDFYRKEKDNKDPVIHFYEDFLKEYDAKKKMEMGVFYTPRPVVQFIIRAVDDILKNEFGLAKGLVDTSKIQVDKIGVDAKGKKIKKKTEYHKVQILDVATGTGTFLNEVIHKVYESFKGQEGRWSTYVENDLLPRLHGFELMMASYTIAHLKLGMTLHDTGVKNLDKRIGVYLSNTLEAPALLEIQPSMFGVMESIVQERKSASKIKSEYPIMCVVGNPPYSISSNNKGEWILEKIEDYKKGLNEKKINIDDDYIKFIRFAQYLIDKNGEGVVAYISNNSFIGGVTHRKMRESLLKSFSSIYILDLHGNARIGEVAPDGGKDQNVFDIMQGVSINIFIKSKKQGNELAKVYHCDLYGDRNKKYEILNNNSIASLKWNELNYSEPYYFFIPKDFSESIEYEKGFKISEFFEVYSAGIKTKVDNLAIDFTKDDLINRIQDIIENKYTLKEVINKFNLSLKTTWEYNKVLEIKEFDINNISNYDYRPFDQRFIYYDKNFLSRSRSEVMDNFYKNENIGLENSRNGDYVFISKIISDEHFVSDNSFKFPLYLHTKQGEKVPNLKKEIWNKINQVVGETTPENILDYIYAVLHSPKYRETYKEFLKIDFPRVPYPTDKKEFERFVKLGERLRGLHLMTDPECEKLITKYSISGGDIVDKVKYTDGNIYINDTQYFENVPEISWNFYIGGYQPAQKYLKDRKGRKLNSDEIEHYQKIIKVLFETSKVVKDVDKVI